MNTTHPLQRPWQLGASESAALLRAGRISSVKLIESVLERVQSKNTEVNAIVASPEPDTLLAQAAEADRRLAQGQPAGLLDGIPLTVKDNLWVRGLPATWGVAALRSFVPAEDEAAVRRARHAGAVIIGKTNVPAMALAATTSNDVYGVTRNPLSLALTPGGSSGGAAAAVASGFGALALATDAGGSIRRPAAYTGTVGFKPSSGTLCASNGFPRTSLDFQVIGPMARSVEDCALLTAVLAMDPASFPWLAQPGRPDTWLGERARARRARIMAITPPVEGQDLAVSAALHACAERMARAGHRIDWQPMPYSLPEVEAFWSELLPHGVRAAMDTLGLNAAALPKALQEMAKRSCAATPCDVYRTITRLLDWRQQLRDLWAHTDLVLSPTSPCLAWSHDQAYPAQIEGQPAPARAGAMYAVFPNAAGAPSISVPVPWQLGVGMQLTAAPGHDIQLLAWAWELERVMQI